MIHDLQPHGILDSDIDSMDQKWLEESDKLDRDIDAFKVYFNQHKKCGCVADNCDHYDKALLKALGNRMNENLENRFDIGMRMCHNAMEKEKSMKSLTKNFFQ